MIRRFLVAFLVALSTHGCTSVIKHPDGVTEVKTFGAATVTVKADGTIETESPGISEGITTVLVEIPKAVLRLLAGAAAGMGAAGE